ncbi:MAG: winged helix-turn-helix domain-containing protein [Candidatus Omnitrophica bacterium]|nr:winged helix-turn-helix domain-containing protein [Candidatus Omnitrophota bacterium]
MITEIGITAGEIWHYLESNNETANLEDILKSLDKPRDIVLMSLGWLAREGHMVLVGEAPNFKVSLRK